MKEVDDREDVSQSVRQTYDQGHYPQPESGYSGFLGMKGMGVNTCNSSSGGSLGFGMECQRCCVSGSGGDWH